MFGPIRCRLLYTIRHGGNHPVRWLRRIQQRVAILGEKGWESCEPHSDFHGAPISYKPLITIIPPQTVIISKVGKSQRNSEVAHSVAKKIIPPPFLHD